MAEVLRQETNVEGHTSQADRVGTAAQRYTSLVSKRDPFLVRARRMASLTIPYLFREEGADGATDTELGWHSGGAYLVANLSAKVALALFPPGRPPMKLQQDRQSSRDLAELPEDQRAQLKIVIDKGLGQVEREFVDGMEEDGDTAKLNVAAAKLVVGGTHGFQFYRDGTMRGIPLDKFVCVRDGAGNLLEFVILDNLAYATLPQDVKAECIRHGYIGANATDPTKASEIKVYTHGRKLPTGQWAVYQEVWGFQVQGSEAFYDQDALPFLFDPWVLLEGEDYGRSHVENYEADLQTVEGNTQTVTEGSAAIARFVRYVNPTGLTSKRAVEQARNGDVLSGRADDVTPEVATGKSADFASALSIADRAEQRLAKAFLLASAIQRNGERVTAEEIRFLAKELEDALGGVYSQQVVTLQVPWVRLKLAALQRSGRVTALPKGTVRVKIMGGLAALGRNQDLQALDDWLGGAIQVLGGQVVLQALGPKAIRNYLQRRATALGVDTEGLIPSEDEAAENDQQAQMQQLMQQLGPEGLKGAIQNATANQVANTNAAAKLGAAAPAQPAAPAAPPPQE